MVEIEAEIKEANRTLTYEEIAIQVLLDAAEPLHWTEIAEKGEALGRRDGFYQTSLFNMLTMKPEIFARTDQGTYGLVEGGYEEAGFIIDDLADFLHQTGEPQRMDDVLNEVQAKRPGKEASIQMYLMMHPRFYESLNGRYGLRFWLDAPTGPLNVIPRDFTENDTSARRVLRSEMKGYNVAAIVAADLERYGATASTEATAGERIERCNQ